MMDERKLNINAPLMSVRRSSATAPSLTEAKRKILEKQHTLPYYKSDMTLDQVTEPVAVPFNWEDIPGRSKGDGGSEPQPPKEASITPSPSLPPGKSTSVAIKPLEKECNVANKFRSSNKSHSMSGSVSKIDCDKEKKDEKIKNVEEDDDDDDVYSDALDTLSPTQSFSMNCSVSGVSGLDNLDANKSAAFSTDKQTQDFMMSRFLPAAKAMTLQPSQYASRKQSVPIEQPRDFTKLVREEKKSFVNKHITDIIPYTGQCQEEEEEEESGDEADDFDGSANISAKGCGLFPRLRVRNSLCLLNPVPGMKMRNQFPMSSAYEVGKPNKSSHIRSYSPAPAIKKAWDAIHKSKSSSGAASPDMQGVRKKWTSESNKFAYSGELKQLSRLSSFRRSRAAAAARTSSFRSISQSPFHGARLLGDSKQAENNQPGKLKFPSRGHGSIQEVQSQGAKKSSNSGSLTIEKTLYIDSASTVKLSCSNSSSVDNTQRIDTVVAVLDKREGKERNSTIESFQDMKQLQALEENLDSEVLSSVDASSSTLSSMLHLKAKEDKAKRLTTDQEISQKSMSLQLLQGSFDEDTKINNLQIVVVDDSGKVLPPPLPKSPSESWLCRALPLVSLKNAFLHSNLGTQSYAKRQGSNTASSYTKWETIVKTSNLQHDHVRCSQELTIYKSQHSKS